MSMYKRLTNIWYTAGGPKECGYYVTLIVKIPSWDHMGKTRILLFLKNNVQVFQLIFICITCKLQLCLDANNLKRTDYVSTWHLNYFFQIITVYFFKSFVVDAERTVLRSFTWCTQRKSTLDLEHMDHTVMCHNVPPPGTTMHHSGSLGCQGYTQHLCQRRWNLFDSGDYNVQSSGTHDTPRSIHWDSRSVLASSASNHVTRQSRRHKVRRGHGDFPQKG